MFMKRESYDDRGRNQKKSDLRSHKKRNLENTIRCSLGFGVLSWFCNDNWKDICQE
jgi:hypothetical protein